MIVVLVIGTFFDSILLYFTIIGGYLGVVVCFYVPYALFLKISTRPLSNWKNVFVLILMHLLLLFGWISATMRIFL